MSELHREGDGTSARPSRCRVPKVLPGSTYARHAGPGRSRWTGIALVCAAVLLLGTAVAQERAQATGEPAVEQQPAVVQAPPAPPPDSAPAPPEPVQPDPPEVSTPEPPVTAPSPPRRVSIERLKIATPLINLGLAENGELDVPEAFDIAGWHSNGTAPGDIGPAVVVGHVDSYQGPAIFYRLRELVPGDKVAVDRADGSQVIFEVYDKETVRKDAFPTDRVYGETSTPELRLLTCGGRYDKKKKSYTENVVVFARQVVEPVPT